MVLNNLHLQPFLFFILVFVLKVPLKVYVEREEKRRKEKEKKREKQRDLKGQVHQIQEEIKLLDPMEDFVKVSKLERQIIKLNKRM